MLKSNFNPKTKFIFDSTAHLLLTKSRSNLFLSLLDLNKKVVNVKTSGCINVGILKKKKWLFKL